MGFFFIHSDKTKYLKRVYSTFTNLNKITNNKYLMDKNDIKIIKDVINDNYKYCNWTSSTDFNLLKCEKYTLYQIIFKMIYKILKTYFNDVQTLVFPFHDIYIENSLTNEIINNNINIDFSDKKVNSCLTSQTDLNLRNSAYHPRNSKYSRKTIYIPNIANSDSVESLIHI